MDQQGEFVAGCQLQQGVHRRQPAGLGRGQPLELGAGQVEDVDPVLHQLPGRHGQQQAGGGAWQGSQVDGRLVQGNREAEARVDRPQGFDGIVRKGRRGPVDDAPLHRSLGKRRQDDGIQQTVTHQKIADQITEGLLLQRLAIQAGERRQGQINAHRLRTGSPENLAFQRVVLQLQQQLTWKELRADRYQTIFKIILQADQARKNQDSGPMLAQLTESWEPRHPRTHNFGKRPASMAIQLAGQSLQNRWHKCGTFVNPTGVDLDQ